MNVQRKNTVDMKEKQQSDNGGSKSMRRKTAAVCQRAPFDIFMYDRRFVYVRTTALGVSLTHSPKNYVLNWMVHFVTHTTPLITFAHTGKRIYVCVCCMCKAPMPMYTYIDSMDFFFACQRKYRKIEMHATNLECYSDQFSNVSMTVRSLWWPINRMWCVCFTRITVNFCFLSMNCSYTQLNPQKNISRVLMDAAVERSYACANVCVACMAWWMRACTCVWVCVKVAAFDFVRKKTMHRRSWWECQAAHHTYGWVKLTYVVHYEYRCFWHVNAHYKSFEFPLMPRKYKFCINFSFTWITYSTLS